jgi:glycine cleavage system H lipoate-binding protein
MVSNQLKEKTQKNDNPCIWMQAGVVRRKDCRTDFDCTACRFDSVMRRVAADNQRIREEGRTPKGKRGNIIFWYEKLKNLPSSKRPCIHYMKRRIDFRPCNQDYQCGNCEFDQYFSDQYSVHAVVRPINVIDIKGFKIPHGYYLHRGHTWVKIEENDTVRVGLDDFALRLLGPLDRIEAPLLGKEVRRNRADISLSRGTNVAEILSPVCGVVTASNSELRDRGNLANQDPYTDGWVMCLHSTNLRQDLRELMIGEQASDYLDDEIERLFQVIEEEAGPLAADGGYLGDDIYGNLAPDVWKKLTRQFLHT